MLKTCFSKLCLHIFCFILIFIPIQFVFRFECDTQAKLFCVRSFPFGLSSRPFRIKKKKLSMLSLNK